MTGAMAAEAASRPLKALVAFSLPITADLSCPRTSSRMIAVESAVGRAADPQTPYEVRRGPRNSPPKTDAPRYPQPDARVFLIIRGRFGTTSTDRREGDIRDSGCPAAVRTANFRTRPVRKTLAAHSPISDLGK